MAKPEYLIKPGAEIRSIIFGNSGVGKTNFLGSAIDDDRTSPVVWLDLEGGTKSIQSRCRFLDNINELGDPQPGLIDVIRVRAWTDVQSVYDFLFNARHLQKRTLYRSVVMDSLSEINYASLKHCMKEIGPTHRAEADVPEQRDYLRTNSLMKDMLRAFRDLEGVHVFFSALPQVKAEKDISEISYLKPNLIGKLADEAVAIVDYVGYLRAKMDKKREMIFQPEGKIIAKERSEFGHHIAKLEGNPITMTQFMNAIEGKTNASN